jgi:hypothetical protein
MNLLTSAVDSAYPPETAKTRSEAAFAQLGLWCFLGALWLLLYPYAGMKHDARLYTLQAQGHMAPDLYGQDIFLRFGSQDNFTLFTPIYAWLCSWLGIEHAAALLTACGQWLFLAGCWLIARRLTNYLMATATLGLVLILPGNYGSDFIFTYLETFITPRLFAEALTLFSLLCFWKRRYALTGAFLFGAILLHPIMAMAGVGFLVATLALQHPKRFTQASALTLVVVTILLLTPLGIRFRFDSEWLNIVAARAPCLFLQNWLYADWARLSVPALTLFLSSLFVLDIQKQIIAKASLLTAAGGLLVTAYGADLFKVIVITQGQAWRWLWLSTVLALLLLPSLMQLLWQRNLAGRSTAVLLAAAWLVRNESSSLGIAALTMAAGIACYKNLGDEIAWRKYWLGSCALLAATIGWTIAMQSLFAGLLVYTYHWPNWLDEWRTLLIDGPLPFALLAGMCWIASQSRRWLHAGCSMICCILVIGLCRFGWQNWGYEEYSTSVLKSMEPWRRLIPAGTEVLWMNGPPTPTWMALQRPSYISSIQTTVTLFSRPAAMELKKRAVAVDAIFTHAQPMVWTGVMETFSPSTHSLSEICARIPVQFLVSSESLDVKPVANATPDMPPIYLNSRLYQCPQPT